MILKPFFNPFLIMLDCDVSDTPFFGECDTQNSKHYGEGARMLKTFFSWVQACAQSERGTTVVEYGLIAAGIAVAIAVTVGIIGEDITLFFDTAPQESVASDS